MVEKRKHIRHDLVCKVEYAPLDDPKAEARTSSFNISLGGIGLEIREFIKGNGKLKLAISDPASGIPIEARGHLVWQSGTPGFSAQRAGIKFTEIPWSRLKVLLRQNV